MTQTDTGGELSLRTLLVWGTLTAMLIAEFVVSIVFGVAGIGGDSLWRLGAAQLVGTLSASAVPIAIITSHLTGRRIDERIWAAGLVVSLGVVLAVDAAAGLNASWILAAVFAFGCLGIGLIRGDFGNEHATPEQENGEHDDRE